MRVIAAKPPVNIAELACTALAPELFELDELGYARARGDGIVPEELQDKAWLAQANCPEHAIDVNDD